MNGGGDGQAPVIDKDYVKEKYLDSPCKTCGRKERRHKWVDKALLEACWEQGIVATVCDKHHGEVKIALTRGYNVEGLRKDFYPCDEEFMKEISECSEAPKSETE